MKLKLLIDLIFIGHSISAQTFTESPQMPPFEGVLGGSIAFADVDGDNDQDVLITGDIGSGTLISKMYTNDGKGNFTEMTATTFVYVRSGSIAFSDVDGDNCHSHFVSERFR
jgi:hypothetical protein